MQLRTPFEPPVPHSTKSGHFVKCVGDAACRQQTGEDFKDHIFRFQILDEAAEYGRDWHDVLTDVLSADN
jgi:hypothetical protein